MVSSDVSLWRVVVYGLACAGSLTAGGIIAAYWPPKGYVRSYIQHVAAGFVFAAVAVEVLPDILHRNLPLAVAGGFAAGGAWMLALRIILQRFTGTRGRASHRAFIGVVTTDIFIDGLLIGVSAITDREQGQQALLVTVALAVELLSLGLSLAVTMAEEGYSRTRLIMTTGIVALSPLIGVIGGYLFGGTLPAVWIESILAFAAAVLLYLAAEELLKEAHEVPETAMGTALFFAAFLVLLLIDMVSV